MRKNILMYTNLIISVIIVIGFIIMSLINYHTYSKYMKDNIENISKLTSSNIYSEINCELTKPVFVSLTMANDTFLKKWILEEDDMVNNKNHRDKLLEYLNELRSRYNYNSAFMISAKTNIYYNHEGIQKKVSKENNHDFWYYDFINSNKLYGLDVDLDESDNNVLTVFVNCKVEDSNGNLIGVVGVGLKMNQLQEMLKYYEKNFHIKSFLVNSKGIIQVHVNNNFIQNKSLTELFPETMFSEKIITNKDSSKTQLYWSKNKEKCLITKYIDGLEWYLIVEKDNSIARNSVKVQIFKDFVIAIIIIIVLIVFTRYIINYYKKMMTKLVTTDELTGLPNRRVFNESIQKVINEFRQNNKEAMIFVFDVDRFKEINDSYGHLFGDFVIKKVGEISKEVVGDYGIVTRWGGDEFFGVIYGSKGEAEKVLLNILNNIHHLEEFKNYNISVSIGATSIRESDDMDTLLIRADKGLYDSKVNGRNRVTFL